MIRKYILFRNVFNCLRKNIRLFADKNSEEIIFDTCGDKGIITLNRPKALNSLTLSMVKCLLSKLVEWECCKKIVIIKGAGNKAFCSGADVRAIVLANKKKQKYGYDFFRTEYAMNGVIGTYNIPYVAYIDGIVMGGGAGLSVHGPIRIATERTLFAMPETQIALFPDVGMSYFLSRMEGKLGLFLALTGHRLQGYDTYLAGIATHFVNSKDLPDLHKCLIQCNDICDIKKALKEYSVCKDAKFSLQCFMDDINECFGAESVECILENLKKKCSWGQDLCKLLMKMSPTSLKVTFELIKRANTMCKLEDCLRLEYDVASNTLDRCEFNEGVRALLIDKDKKPNWNPECLKGVTKEIVEAHFCAAKCGLPADFRKTCNTCE